MRSSVQFLNDLTREIGQKKVRSDDFTAYCYESDIGKSVKSSPIAVVFPENSEDVATILKNANDYCVPVTVRGGGTTVGGETVARDSVIIDTKKMCEFLDIDTSEKLVHLGSGMTWIELYDFLREYDSTFKVAPSSATCTIGGTVSVGGFDNHSFKHGASADQVREVEVVLPNGDIKICNSEKNSEIFSNVLYGNGMIGVITKVKMEITGLNRTSYDSWFAYTDRKTALRDYFRLCENEVCDGLMYLEVFNQPIVRIEQFGEPVDIHQIKGKHINTFMDKDFYIKLAQYMYAQRIRVRSFPFLLRYSPVSNSFIDIIYPDRDCLFEMIDYSDKLRKNVKMQGIKTMGNLKLCLGLRVKEDSKTRPFSPIPLDIKKDDLIFGLNFGTELLSKDYLRYQKFFSSEIIRKAVGMGGMLYKYGGHVRQFAEEMFSDERWGYLLEIKKKYDPNNILNRGVLFE
ncbi:MAG: FAD-binding oxidoreductase [Candidatus Methanoperedens sp.]|nr:MAG: FAD-binding oxidoreductase [Candidatus Methanoperedens sp.]